MKKWLCILLCSLLAFFPAMESRADAVKGETTAETRPAGTEPAETGTPDLLQPGEIFSNIWGELLEGIAQEYEEMLEGIRFSRELRQPVSWRLSLEPDALKLLDFASQTLAQTDISWIWEAGIDLIPSVQDLPAGTYAYGYTTPNVSSKEICVPGITALLHINGQEIASADAWLDMNLGAVYARFPGLVSGTLINPNLFRGGNSSRQMLEYYGAMSRLGDLLPTAELVREILEVPAGLSEKYVPVSVEKGRLTAGSVSQDCVIYTGDISLQDVAGLLDVLWEKAETDPEFREALADYIDNSLWRAYQENMGVQLLVEDTARNIFGLPNLGMWLNRSFLEMAVESGEWEYLREDLDPRNAAESETEEAETAVEMPAETSEAAAETTVEETEAAEPEFTYRDLEIEPGVAYSPEILAGMNSKMYSLLFKGYMNREIGLTREFLPSEVVFRYLDQIADSVESSIAQLKESVPPGVSGRLGFSFDEDENLIGVSLDASVFGQQMPLFSAGAAYDDQNVGLVLTVGGEENAQALLEFLRDPMTDEMTIHLLAFENENLHASAEGSLSFSLTDDQITMDFEVKQEEGTILLLEGLIDSAEGSADIKLHIPETDSIENRITFSGSHDSEMQHGSYVLRTERIRRGANQNTALYPDMVQQISPDILIETDGLGFGSLLLPQGSISIGLGNWAENPIPEGMKLVLNVTDGKLQIADDSAVYLSLEAVRSEYVSTEEAAARIRKHVSEMKNNYSYRSQLGSNWNPLVVINRLLQAGMPTDQLKNLNLNWDSFNDILRSLGIYF